MSPGNPTNAGPRSVPLAKRKYPTVISPTSDRRTSTLSSLSAIGTSAALIDRITHTPSPFEVDQRSPYREQVIPHGPPRSRRPRASASLDDLCETGHRLLLQVLGPTRPPHRLPRQGRSEQRGQEGQSDLRCAGEAQ